MARNKNIFFRVAKPNEDTVTEILTNMMSRKYIRNIFLKKAGIENELIETVEYKDIFTQVTIRNQKRPDIVVENNSLSIFIENKIYINTHLQDSQVTDYYKELETKGTKKKIILFLVPKGYKHLNYIEEAKQKYSSIDTIILFWENIINELLVNDIDRSDSSIKDAMDFLIDTLGLNTIKKTFSRGEIVYMFDNHTLKNVISLFKKMELYTTEVSKEIYNNYKDKLGFKNTVFEMDDRNIGTWITPEKGGDWLLFIGYNFQDKSTENPSLLNLRIHESLIKSDSIENIPKCDKWYSFPLPKSIFANEENVPSQLRVFVEKVIEKYCM